MRLLVKKLNENATVPQRQTPYSAGYDLCSAEDITAEAGKTVKVHTGISVELDGAKDVCLFIYARSSLAAKFGLAPANCVGVVDWDYRGEIIVALHNHSDKDYDIKTGDRVAQLVITNVLTPETQEVSELSETVRGEGGFGSTGKN